MVRFLIFLAGVSILMLVILHAGIISIPSFSGPIILYFTVTTGVVVYMIRKKSGPVLFTQRYLVSIVMKMLTGSIFILIIIFEDGNGAFKNAALFIISYLLYTTLEVIFLYDRASGESSKLD